MLKPSESSQRSKTAWKIDETIWAAPPDGKTPAPRNPIMQELEIIQLLASRDKIKRLLEDLPEILDNFQDIDGKKEIRVYSRDTFDTDLLICLRRERNGQPDKSREGLLLAEYLRDFGMVEHQVWEQKLPSKKDEK